MVNAFLKGAQEAGADTFNRKEIKHCKCCHTSWDRGPGRCVSKDDMLESCRLRGATIIVFASPIYFENISGMLKVFMDRMTMLGSPHAQKNVKEERQHVESAGVQASKLMLISSCGYPDRSEFDVTSLWIKRVAQKMRMKLVGEIYATQGKFLTSPTEELRPIISNYLQLLEKAGAEIATDMKFSPTTYKLLQERNFTLSQ
ncbi:flavodoxin family protein [Desulfosporosinus sp. Sb-LF]|nr:flavodoxin family protein [Desulfosporosinus sp. Sb-LF]